MIRILAGILVAVSAILTLPTEAIAGPILPVSFSTTPFNSGWVQSQTGGFIPHFVVTNPTPPTATIGFSDGTSATFAGTLSPFSKDLIPVQYTMAGYLSTSAGTLAITSGVDVAIIGSSGPVQLVDFFTLESYEPTSFRFTASDGGVFDFLSDGSIVQHPTPPDVYPLGISLMHSPLGDGWSQSREGGFLPTYHVVESVSHSATVALSDGSVLQFVPLLLPDSSAFTPLGFIEFAFRPSLSWSLGVFGDPGVLVSGGIGPVTLLSFDGTVFSPTEFRLRRADGEVFDLRVASLETQPVPEPASLLLFGCGLAGVIARAKRRAQKHLVTSRQR